MWLLDSGQSFRSWNATLPRQKSRANPTWVLLNQIPALPGVLCFPPRCISQIGFVNQAQLGHSEHTIKIKVNRFCPFFNTRWWNHAYGTGGYTVNLGPSNRSCEIKWIYHKQAQHKGIYIGLPARILKNSQGHVLTNNLVSILTASQKETWLSSVDLLESKKAQQKDLDRLDQWTEANCMKSTQPSARSWTWATTPPCNVTGLGKSGWKLPIRKGPVGQQPGGYEPLVCPGAQKGK